MATRSRSFQECFGWDAATVQTGATNGVFFDKSDIEPSRCTVKGRGVSAGTATNNNEVVLVSHGGLLQSSIRRCTDALYGSRLA